MFIKSVTHLYTAWCLYADDKTCVQLKVFVEKHADTRLNAGKDQLLDNLVIRITGGDDIPVSFERVFLI